MTEKQWLLYAQNPTLSEKVAQELNLAPVIGQVLLNRKIKSLNQAKQFLNPASTSQSQFDSPSLLKLTELIKRCIQHQRTIMIYGDYDVDGITSTSMMLDFLTLCGAKVVPYIPHRFNDGYGLSSKILPQIIEHQAALLITLDCGISNVQEIADIKSAGTAVAIMDHHTLPDILPNADVTFNPKFLSPEDPLYPLCTAGIVYKWIEFASTQFENIDPERFIDLAAIGTIADVANLWGENRRIVTQGLPILAQRKRPGLRALLDIANHNKPVITVQDIGFTIGPRLNAAGRLGHAKIGVDLLSAKTEAEATPIAIKLQQLNETRQAMGTSILQDALKLTSTSLNNITVLASEQWHAGVIGIIASRLVEKYCRPAVLIAIQDGLGRGSARTFGDINVYQLLYECKSFFKTFGGHKEAAGFSILPEVIPEFCEALTQVAAKSISPQALVPKLDIDCPLDPHWITPQLKAQIDILGPFGQSNPTPVFWTEALKVIEIRPVGNGQHLKITFTDPTSTKVLDGIAFQMGHKLELAYTPNIKVAFQLETNYWNGKESLQLNILDIKS